MAPGKPTAGPGEVSDRGPSVTGRSDSGCDHAPYRSDRSLTLILPLNGRGKPIQRTSLFNPVPRRNVLVSPLSPGGAATAEAHRRVLAHQSATGRSHGQADFASVQPVQSPDSASDGTRFLRSRILRFPRYATMRSVGAVYRQPRISASLSSLTASSAWSSRSDRSALSWGRTSRRSIVSRRECGCPMSR